MGRYIARRLLQLILILFVISILTFFLFWATPAQPAYLICGKNCTPDNLATINHAYGLDKPLIVQYLDYMGGLFHGRTIGSNACAWPCLSYSFQNSLPVTTLLKQSIMPTVWLAIGASILWLIFGVATGLIAALKRGRWQDRVSVGLALFGVSFPTLVLGYVLLYILVIVLKVLPFPDNTFQSIHPDGFSVLAGVAGWLKFFILPWITLAVTYAALYTRLTRANMIDTLGEDYIRTARAKGLTERRVIFKHGLRAALAPIVTIYGLDLGGLLGGAVITEKIFGIQGLGNLSITAVFANDLPVLMAVVLIAAFFIVFANIVVDVLYAFIDPRVRLS